MKDDIIKMAHEAGIYVTRPDEFQNICIDDLERFAALVRADEREACAAVARQWDADHPASNYGGCIANLIEARGQA
jgi:hypothetical protein